MRNLLLTAVIILVTTTLCFGQGELDLQQKAFYRNERTFGVLLSTDGYGIGYREGKRIDFRNKRLYEIDLGILKHPREIRLQNPAFQTGSTFVFGKLNSVIFLRGGLGKQHELFTKEDLGGVAVRYFYSAGPDFIFYKPIYYKVLYPVSSTTYSIREEKFQESIHSVYDIYSKASFTKGLKELGVVPGIYGKAGFNFEYSKQDKIIHAIELGSTLNIFPKKIPIMASADNKSIFLSLFVSYRMGLIIDPLDPQSNRISTIFIRNR
jgi:hypothetical protein